MKVIQEGFALQGPGTGLAGNPGKSPDRFQVIVRLDAEISAGSLLDAPGITGGGKLEKTVLSRGSALGDGQSALHVFSFPESAPRDVLLSALSKRPGVEAVELDNVVGIALASTDPIFTAGNQWGAGSGFGTNADLAWADAGISADGRIGSMKTVIGVIDTGIDPTHPDLYLNVWLNAKEIPAGLGSDIDGDGVITMRDLNAKNASGTYLHAVSDLNANGYIDADDILNDARWSDGLDSDGNGYVDDLFGWDFYNNDNRPFEAYTGSSDPTIDGEPSDSYHGTHVAGTIGASANGAGVVGVAWDVQLMPLRFLGPDGSGYTSDAIAAVNYYAALGQANPSLDFIATNNSWGGTGASQSLANAIQSAGNLGHLFIAAAGNDTLDNDDSGHWPSNYEITSTFEGISFDPVISVASIDESGALSSFSNWGATSVDIGAPGGRIASTFAGTGYFGEHSYIYLSGTSMATPHVAGAVALISAENPGLHPADLREAMLSRATPTASLDGLTVTGGRLDISQLVDMTRPTGTMALADADLTLASGATVLTLVFSEVVPQLAIADLLVSQGHGALSNLQSVDGLTWTATFTPADVETEQGYIVMAGGSFADTAGNTGSDTIAVEFSIDRLAPTAKVAQISADTVAGGVEIAVTLDSPLQPDDALRVFRDGIYLGDATQAGAIWRFVDTATLSYGTYEYTVQAVDAKGNAGARSLPANYEVAPALDFNLLYGVAETRAWGNHFEGASDADGLLAAGFEGTGSTVALRFTAYDVNFWGDVKVFLNGALLANLDATARYDTAEYELLIAADAQLAGTNVLTFQSTYPGNPWGVTDLVLTSPIAPSFTLVPGTTEDGAWGNRFEGASDADGIVTAAFSGTGQDMVLGFTTYDINFWGEVSLSLNGRHLAKLTQTGSGQTGYFEVLIPAAEQLDGENVIGFEAAYPKQAWGVTDILLESTLAPAFALELGVPETRAWGNRFNGANDADGIVVASFTGTNEQLALSMSTWDINFWGEVSILLNDEFLVKLDPTGSGSGGTFDVFIPAALQLTGENTIAFVSTYPKQAWGVTDIVLESTLAPAFVLTPGVIEEGAWGNRFDGASDPDGLINASFAGTESDLLLSMTTFDVNFWGEVTILLNDGFLAKIDPTGAGNRGSFDVSIPAADQLVGENILSFVATYPNQAWGVTDLLIEAPTIG